MKAEPLDPGRLSRAAERLAGRTLRHCHGGADAWTVLLTSLRSEAYLSPHGLAWARSLLVRERMRADALAEGPPTSIEVPTVVITGLARSGTTALHRLIVHRFAAACLLFDDSYGFGLHGRFTVGSTRAARGPGGAAHPFASSAPEECDGLFLPSFRSALYAGYFNVPRYGAWLEDSGQLDPGYDAYAAGVAALLSGREVTRWAVKSPTHLSCLAQVERVYPNVVVVWAVRDAVTALASTIGLAARFRAALSDRPWSREDSERVVDAALLAVERGVAAARRVARGRLCAIRFSDLTDAPEAVVRAVGQLRGWDLVTAPDSNPPASRSAASYSSLDDTLLPKAQRINALLDEVLNEFGVPGDAACRG